MQSKQPKIQYNEEAKIVSIKVSSAKSVDSDVQGNVVVDYDVNGDVVNIDIMEVNVNDFEKINNLTANRAFAHLAR